MTVDEHSPAWIWDMDPSYAPGEIGELVGWPTEDRRVRFYRFFDDEGLLYAGITCQLIGRFFAHRNREWWPLVTGVNGIWFTERAHALQFERGVIEHEHPPYNILGTPRLAARRRAARVRS